MSSPRLEPWLMPETTRSGWKPSISPSAASRTQSTGVPSHAKPFVPSSKPTSVTHSGRREGDRARGGRAVGVRRDTASSTSSTPSSARRSVCRPVAPIPSSLVSSTRSIGLSSLVGDGFAGRARARARCGRPPSAARPSSSRAKSSSAPPRPPASSSIVPTSTRFMLRMNESASIENSSTSPSALPAGAQDVALEAPVVAVGGREGGEVVRAGQQRRRTRAGRPRRTDTGARARGRARTARARCGRGSGSGRRGCGRRGGRRSRRAPARRPARRSRAAAAR